MSEIIDWNKLTIPQLKDQLKKRGLDQSGKKADLVSRLLASDQAHQEDLGSGKSLNDPALEYEAKDDEQMDSSENPDDSRAAEPDFTENITFEELERSAAADDGTQQPVTDFEAKASRQEGSTEAQEEGGGGGPAEEGKDGGEEMEGDGAKGEGKTAGEGTEDGKETVEELPDVSSQFYIDVPRERDFFNLTWNGKKFVVPFRLEINSDLLPTYKAQSLVVYPVQLADIDTDLFKRLFEKATKFSIDFNESKSGQVKFLFKSAEEAEKAKEELKVFRETFSTEPMDFEFKEYEDDFVPVNKKTEQLANTGSLVHRLLFVGNLPSDVTESALAELIPDALRVILPHIKENEGNAENLQQTRHAYFEYSSEEDATAALEKYKELTLNDERLFVIKAIPVRKDKFGLLSDSLRQIFLDKIRKLQNIIKTPYNKSQQDLDDIQKNIDQTKEKLAADTKHRLGWGMLLGRLDECVLDREDAKFFDNQRGRGRGGRGQMRGGSSYYDGQGARRGMLGMGGSPRGSYGYGGGSGMGYGRGGWNSGYGGGYQSYYGGGGSTYPSQSYGGGYNQFSGKRRGSYDNYGGEWKRGRGGGGSYQY